MSTSWERLVATVRRTHQEIGETHLVPPRVVASMLLTAARMEGGPGDEPGIGDQQFAPTAGPSYGWYQFNVGYSATRPWQPVGRHLMMTKGWTIDDMLDEEKVVALWGPELCRTYRNSPPTDDRERQAIFAAERPAAIYPMEKWRRYRAVALKIIDGWEKEAATDALPPSHPAPGPDYHGTRPDAGDATPATDPQVLERLGALEREQAKIRADLAAAGKALQPPS